jgi:uncharacterized protein YidB (DUF937 family)
MGLLDGVLGGVVGGEMATVVNSLIQQHGGIQGVIAQLEKQGLGATARSWVSTGPNQPISADQVNQVFGSGMLGQLAAKAGLNPQELSQKLSQVLPTAIDKLTPGGQIPAQSGPAKNA